MAGNFISRAVLSLFMDKSAREKYTAIQEAKRDARAGKKSKATPEPVIEPAVEPAAAPNDDDISDLDVLPETLVKQAIDAAAEELERKKNMPPGRQALIEQALTIQDRQRKLLDDLPKEQREKLQLMAMHAFGADMDAKKAAKKTAKKKPPLKKPLKKS